MDLELTKAQNREIAHLALFKSLSLGVVAFGLLGLLVGFYAIFFRGMSADAKPLNFSLIMFSFGLIGLGWQLRRLYRIIEILAKGKNRI